MSESEFICSRCRAPKGEHALGESCNGNCGGKVIRNPRYQRGHSEMKTRKLIVCLDEHREADRALLTNVRILDGDTLEELVASGVGAWGSFDAALDYALHEGRKTGRLKILTESMRPLSEALRHRLTEDRFPAT